MMAGGGVRSWTRNGRDGDAGQLWRKTVSPTINWTFLQIKSGQMGRRGGRGVPWTLTEADLERAETDDLRNKQCGRKKSSEMGARIPTYIPNALESIAVILKMSSFTPQ